MLTICWKIDTNAFRNSQWFTPTRSHSKDTNSPLSSRERKKDDRCDLDFSTDPFLLKLREKRFFDFDTREYDLLGKVTAILQTYIKIPLPDLDLIHECEETSSWHTDGSKNEMNKLQARWNNDRCVHDYNYLHYCYSY